MREVLFPRLIRLRADDDLVHDLAEAARRDKLSLSEFAGRELRKAVARTPVSVGRTDDDGPGPGGTAPACARRLDGPRPHRRWRCLSRATAVQTLLPPTDWRKRLSQPLIARESARRG
jgi:hypothetical protein